MPIRAVRKKLLQRCRDRRTTIKVITEYPLRISHKASACRGGSAVMEQLVTHELSKPDPADLLDARDCLHLLIMEYGDTHIDTLAQLLHLTSSVEIEFHHICARRLS